VGNLYTGHQTGYNVPESDLAIIVVLRHSATGYGYNNALWSKHGQGLDSKAATPPAGNPYDSGDRVQLSALARRGVQFMVCGTASRGISRRLAGEKGDADVTFKEMEANLIASARIVPAGVVGVTHAQEYGFSYLYVG
jgi:intracellular sulfur oxidation DsrE/DsrF family protein